MRIYRNWQLMTHQTYGHLNIYIWCMRVIVCISHNYSLMGSNCKKPKAWLKVVGSRSRKSCLRRRSRWLPARSPRALQPLQPLQRWVGRKAAGNTRDEDWTRCQDFFSEGCVGEGTGAPKRQAPPRHPAANCSLPQKHTETGRKPGQRGRTYGDFHSCVKLCRGVSCFWLSAGSPI